MPSILPINELYKLSEQHLTPSPLAGEGWGEVEPQVPNVQHPHPVPLPLRRCSGRTSRERGRSIRLDKLLSLFAMLLVLFSAAAGAQDAATEARMARLTEQLRCLVCQNQTIEDSNADLAVDLRRQIRSQIEAGKSDEQILNFLVQRYGEFVLYRPRLKTATVLLWFGPLLFLAIGAGAMIITVRKRAARKLEQTREEHEKALALLNRSP